MANVSDGVHLRTCPLCEAMCGLEITVRDGRVSGIRPDAHDVWSKGYICPKGAVLGELHHDPDRLRAPLLRDGSTWRTVSWNEALAEVERRLHGVIERHGREAVAAYIGNPTAHNFSLGRYVGAFIGLTGIRELYSAGTVDQWPKNLVGALLYGGMWTIPVPDLDRTHHLLMLGANPAASQGSLLAAADVLGRLDAIRARGGKVVLVDPRRTGTAEHADEWIPIRPGTDAALLMAMVHVLFAEGLVNLRDLRAHIDGVETVGALCREFSPEAVAETCAVDAPTIRRLARELAAAPAAAVYGRIGTCTQEFGTLTSWLVEVLNVLTGNLDRVGGSMFANPIAFSIATLRPPDQADGFQLHRWRSRVRGAPEVLGQYPLSCMAEEIATHGAGQLKALITIAGNPVISAPDAGKLDAALPLLECMVSVDNYLNETTRHAHVILPGLSPLEQLHFDDLIPMWAVRSFGNYSPAVFPRDEGRPEEWEILLRLGAMIAGMKREEIDVATIDDGYFSALCAAQGVDATTIMPLYDRRGPERLLDLQIRT